MDNNHRAALTMLCDRPRTHTQLAAAVAWSDTYLAEVLNRLAEDHLAYMDWAGVWRPAPAGYTDRGHAVPEVSNVPEGFRLDPPHQDSTVTLKLDATEALKDLAELKASIRDERAFKVLLALLATVHARASADDLARRAYALVDALELAR